MLAALFLSLSTGAAAAPAPEAPPVREGFCLRPHFELKGHDPTDAGIAFPLRVDDRIVVVTAFDLFGPNGGLAEQVPAAKLSEVVKGVDLRDAFTSRPVTKLGPPLPLADAEPMGQTAAHDIAVFPAAAPDEMAAIAGQPVLRPAKLAAADPAVGDPIWVVAPQVGAAADAPRAIPATVAAVEDGWLFYTFAADHVDLTGTAGAPVVDAAGDVVGMQLGGGVLDGKMIGSANPRVAIAEHVRAALGAAAK